MSERRAFLLLLLFTAIYSNSFVTGSQWRRCGTGNFDHLFTKNVSKDELCIECEEALCTYREKGFHYLFEKFKLMCLTGKSKFPAETCLEILNMYKEELDYIIWYMNVSDSEACSFVLQCGNYEQSSVLNWDFPLPITPLEAEDHVASENFTVFHLTDTHVSTQYTVGSSFDCSDELCCTERQLDTPMSPMTGAGPYGDIRGISFCDLPIRTLKSLLSDATNRKFDYVYLTGDFVPHTAFNYSFGRVISEIASQTDLIDSYLKSTLVIPVIGNHDDYPFFLFPTHKMMAGKYSIDKLYKALWKIWGGRWIPSDEEDNFKKGGYFSVLLRPGFRVFSLNTIYCYVLNYWLVVNPKVRNYYTKSRHRYNGKYICGYMYLIR